ncbi:MAG: hypothetical protein E7301_00095 [Butyrivibrio sp.]|nr:hypothetical protein [Butyrivibrio sp.]
MAEENLVQREIFFTRDSFCMGDDVLAPNLSRYIWTDSDWCPEIDINSKLESYLGCNLPGYFWRGYADGKWICDVNLHREEYAFSRKIVLNPNWREMLRKSRSIYFKHTEYSDRDKLPMEITDDYYTYEEAKRIYAEYK